MKEKYLDEMAPEWFIGCRWSAYEKYVNVSEPNGDVIHYISEDRANYLIERHNKGVRALKLKIMTLIHGEDVETTYR